MVRPPSYDKYGVKKGAWNDDEDKKLTACIQRLGYIVPNWRLLPLAAGLKRCGKSCRLRWMNYLKPGLNREKFTKFEEDLIIELHNKHGNKWSKIAANFPGRTDNDIKNYWHAHIKKRINRAIRAQSDQEQSSDDTSSCITTDLNQEEAVLEQVLSVENPGPFESNADSNYNGEILDIDLPPLIPEEEFNGFELWRNGVTYDYSDTATFYQDGFLVETVEEESFSMRLWA